MNTPIKLHEPGHLTNLFQKLLGIGRLRYGKISLSCTMGLSQKSRWKQLIAKDLNFDVKVE
jgi:hypothetical protein